MDLTYVMGDLPYRLSEDWQEHGDVRYKMLNLHTPFPPVNFNFRSDAVGERGQLTPEELAYFKRLGSAVIFIHGYNVELGEFGKVLEVAPADDFSWCGSFRDFDYDNVFPTAQQVLYQDSVSWPELPHSHPEAFRLRYSNTPALVCRDLAHLRDVFPVEMFEQVDLSDDPLNGSGAHNWWLHMEFNLNRAAGFKGFTRVYRQGQPFYKRIINVAWQGDPSDLLDYELIDGHAFTAADKLKALVQQLRRVGVKLQVIAHSAGNIVLLELMSLLPADTLENVFLWEPAVPDNVLAAEAKQLTPHDRKTWQPVKAAAAAKSVYVLYSLHDNVLGPIPMSIHHLHEADINIKFTESAFGERAALLALSVTVFDQLEDGYCVPNVLQSVYAFAQELTVPLPNLFFDASLRKQVYKIIKARIEAQTPFASVQPCLKEQVLWVQKKYPHGFVETRIFLGFFMAIMVGGIAQFLSDPRNKKPLEKFREQALSPEGVNCFDHFMAAAIQADFPGKSMSQVAKIFSRFAMKMPGYVYLNFFANMIGFAVGETGFEVILEQTQGVCLSLLREFLGFNEAVLMPSQLDVGLLTITLEMMTHFAVHWGLEVSGDILDKPVQYLLDDYLRLHPRPESEPQLMQAAAEVATLLVTLAESKGSKVRPALGYSGPSRSMRQSMGAKLHAVNQTGYLVDHSAMKHPDEAVFKRVYQGVIMAASSVRQGFDAV